MKDMKFGYGIPGYVMTCIMLTSVLFYSILLSILYYIK